MSAEGKVSALEHVLMSYVKKYGFTDEAREYFIGLYLEGEHLKGKKII